MNARITPPLALLLVALTASCALDAPEERDATPHERDSDGATVNVAGEGRRARATAIRDIAAAEGLTNGVLLAGIAQVESALSHCWSEAKWACQGPYSASCGGPVIAGAADGPCNARQGGLGMFQFDGGDYDQTLARDGDAILTLDGNIVHAVDFVVGITLRERPELRTREGALAWMNGIAVQPEDPDFARWNALLACRYNGACGSARQTAKYRDATLAVQDELGEAFWAMHP
ncbi:MAG: hypothetical protein ABW252_05580 [Polyangiales bacterium]